ncbi:MAG: hypothetical protein BWX78_01781 [Firmicutes bacterium ADurb.Bin099]|nr:MAG: hypothetical protein BWX78_01781 [Firmicutes bacterium ADurb.Bin099]
MFRCLLGISEYHIRTYIIKPRFFTFVYIVNGGQTVVDSSHIHQYPVVKRLYTETYSVDSHLSVLYEIMVTHNTGIDLNSYFGIFIKCKTFQHLIDILHIHMRGCSSSEIYTVYSSASKFIGIKGYFGYKGFEIRSEHMVHTRKRMEIAVIAFGLTKRYVNVYPQIIHVRYPISEHS